MFSKKARAKLKKSGKILIFIEFELKNVPYMVYLCMPLGDSSMLYCICGLFIGMYQARPQTLAFSTYKENEKWRTILKDIAVP